MEYYCHSTKNDFCGFFLILCRRASFHFGCGCVTQQCDNIKFIKMIYISKSTYLIYLLKAQLVKNLPECRRPGFDPRLRKIPWRRKWQPTPVFLSGEFQGQRTLVGYSPWDHKESDTTVQLTFTTHKCAFVDNHLYNCKSEVLTAKIFETTLLKGDR